MCVARVMRWKKHKIHVVHGNAILERKVRVYKSIDLCTYVRVYKFKDFCVYMNAKKTVMILKTKKFVYIYVYVLVYMYT